jgi:hypothetical protein
MFKVSLFAVDLRAEFAKLFRGFGCAFHQRGFPTLGNGRAALYVDDAAHRGRVAGQGSRRTAGPAEDFGSCDLAYLSWGDRDLLWLIQFLFQFLFYFKI